MKVTIVGQGYVGLPLALQVAMVGHSVVGFDIDQSKIEHLKQGITQIPDVDLKIISLLLSENRYIPSCDPKLMADSDVIVLAVPTPLDKKGKPDTSALVGAANIVAQYCMPGALIINESTSFPGTLRNLIHPIFEKKSNSNLLFSSAPERVDPGNNTWNLKNTARVVSGLNETATQKTLDFYSTFCSNIQIVSSPEIAETAKLFENTFRMVNIALVNELALICKNLRISTHEVLAAASTKPFGFMPFFPGIGVGGHCIPVDPMYLAYSAKLARANSDLIESAHDLNSSMPKQVSELIKAELDNDLSGKNIQIVGIAYKPDVPDLRESPALELMIILRSMGARVIWCDPVVGEYEGELSSDLDTTVDLGVILTPHRDLNFSVWREANTKVIDISSNSANYGWPKFL
jgi:UDP-N-acetyl-D-glucosamine dehydrogenase